MSVSEPYPVAVRAMDASDWPQVERIYRQGIETGLATFEAEAPTWAEFDASRLRDHRLVAVDDAGLVQGWVAVAPVSGREVYRGVVEHSVYVASSSRGRGVGGALLDALVLSTESAGIWTIQSSLFPENHASLALHRAAGFRTVGHRVRIGRSTAGPHRGEWRDTILVERRSRTV